MCGIILKTLKSEISADLNLSKFMLSDQYELKEIDFGNVRTGNNFDEVFCMSLLPLPFLNLQPY